MPPKKIKSQEEFDNQFKLMVKNIILEEDYVKREDVKDIIIDILNLLDDRVSNKIKEHAVIISKYVIEQLDKK